MGNISFFILDEDKNILVQSIIREPKFDSLNFKKQLYYIDEGSYVALRNI